MANFLKKISAINPLQLATILLFATVLIYVNTLGNGLFFDDQQFIYENKSVTSFDVPGLFSQSLLDSTGRASNYYRPFLFLGFSVEYNLFGNTGFIFHLSSFLIHAAGGIALFFLLLKLTKNKFIAFLTALLFLIHPIQTEAVAYASGRGDPLSFFLVILTIYFSFGKSSIKRISSYLLLILALLSKEMALIAPGLIIISHLYERRSISIKSIRDVIINTLPYTAISIGYFLLRLTVLNFANTLNFYNGQNSYTNSIFVRINEFFHLIHTYLSLIFFPKDLFMERDLSIPVETAPTIWSVTSFIATILSLLLSIRFYKRFPIIFFALAWIMISFIPSCGIIPINGIFYEHFLYYPSVGIFLLLSFAIYALFKKVGNLVKTFILLLLVVAIFALSIRTIMRNADWKDPITFYSNTSKYVQSARIYNNLAIAYADKGEDDKAIDAYKRAMTISDIYPHTHYNLGNIYLKRGNLTQAEKEYSASLDRDPYFYLSYIKLYEIYSVTKNVEKKTQLENVLREIGTKYPEFSKLLTSLQEKNGTN